MTGVCLFGEHLECCVCDVWWLVSVCVGALGVLVCSVVTVGVCCSCSVSLP